MNTVFALIPARGGSKGIPRKNVKPLAGKPLIAWTIEAARAARSVARVIVSTEDGEIADVARQHGAEVPFMRPPELASDSAASVDVVLHAIDWLADHEHVQPDLVLLLQPTSPLRIAQDIDAAVDLQRARRAAAIVSVCMAPHPPEWLRRLGPDGELLPWHAGPEPLRRQDAVLAYLVNGALYLVQTAVLREEKTLSPSRTLAYVMPPERSLDIDTPWDFHLADLVLKERHAAHA